MYVSSQVYPGSFALQHVWQNFSGRIVKALRLIRAASVLTTGLITINPASAASIWTGATSANWNTTGNWAPTALPGVAGVALFNSASANGTTTPVVLGTTGLTVGDLYFDTNSFNGSTGYTIGTTNGNVLTLAPEAVVGILSTFTGSNIKEAINAPLMLLGNATFSNDKVGNTLAFGGAISAPGVAALINLSGDGAGSASGVISDGVGGTVALTKRGAGAWTLSGENTYTGTTTINGGTLQIGNGSVGSLNGSTGTALTFGGTGTINFNEAATSSQGMGMLSFNGGDGTVQSTYGASGNTSLTFSNLAIRTSGATGNFIASGGTISGDAPTNKIIFTNIQDSMPTAGALLDKGIFFGGSAYAAYDSNGYVRALDYTSDADAVIAPAGTDLSNIPSRSDINMTGAISGQTTAQVNTIAISGNNNLALANNSTLFVNGILKSGNIAGGATISGGAGAAIKVASGNGELVIRTDGVNDSLTLSTNILPNGISGLTKSGAGTLTLSGVNSYTGPTFINGGTLKIITVNNQLGNGSATNGITINGGTLDLGGVNRINLNQTVTIGPAGGTLSASTNNDQNINGVFTGSGPLTVAGLGVAHFFSHANTFTGRLILTGRMAGNTGDINGSDTTNGITFLGGSLISENGAIVTAKAVNLAGGGTFGPSGGNITVTGVVSGAGALNIQGAGTVFLTGANSFTGGITVTLGTLNATTASLNGGYAGNSITLNGSPVTLQAGVGGIITGKNVIIQSATGFFDTNGNDSTLSGIISGNNFTKVGTGTLTLNGASACSYSGTTTVNNGALLLNFTNLASATNLLNSASSLALGGGTLRVLGNGAAATSQTLGNLTLTANTSSNVVLTPNYGATNLTLGATWTRNPGSSLLIDLSAAGTRTLTTGLASQTLGYAMVKDAGGTGFARANGTGITRLTGQTVLTAASNLAGTDWITTPAGASSTGSPALTMAGSFSVNTLTIDTSTASGGNFLDLAGGTMTLTSNGLLMTGGSDYTIQGGQVGATASEIIIHQVGSGVLTVNSLLSSGAGSLTKDGPGTLVLGGANAYTGVTAIHNGTVQIGNGAAAGTLGSGGNVLLTASCSNLAFNRTDSVSISNVISGIGTVTQAGSGTVTLAGANTFSGGLTINKGTVVANNNSASALGTGNVTFGSSNTPTLSLNGKSPTVGLLSGVGANSVIKNTAASGAAILTLAGTGSQSYGGVIQNGGTGTIGLTLTCGTQILSAKNTYTGVTTVNGGTLIISGSIAASATTVNAGATLASGNNNTSAVGAVTVASTATGGGTLAPGNTGGSALTSVGKLNVGGVLTLGSATGTAHLSMELGSTTAGTGYDQIALNNTTLNLTNVNLDGSLINGFTPQHFAEYDVAADQVSLSGDLFFLVIGASTVNGTFANQGAVLAAYDTVTFNNQQFLISYTASSTGNSFTGGHDIALMGVVAVPEVSAWALLLGGFGILSMWQRSRRK